MTDARGEKATATAIGSDSLSASADQAKKRTPPSPPTVMKGFIQRASRCTISINWRCAVLVGSADRQQDEDRVTRHRDKGDPRQVLLGD
jgi:hypothetical protein